MRNKFDRTFLQAEIESARILAESVANHPLMSLGVLNRIKELEEELRNTIERRVASTTLYFSGEPVLGSQGIDAQFVSEILKPFVEMVKSEYAAQRHGNVGERGPRRDENHSRLLITSTPRGSFGLELSAPPTDDLFSDEYVERALLNISSAIEKIADSDHKFLESYDEVSPRTYVNMKTLFNVLHDSGANLRITTKDIHFEMDRDQIAQAVERLTDSEEIETEHIFEGRFRGATLDTSKFDFVLEDGRSITGKIDPDIQEESLAEYFKFVNMKCHAKILQITTKTSRGAIRERFILKEIYE